MKKSFALFLALFLLGGISAAMPEGLLILPENLTEVSEECFYADASLDEVCLPEGLLNIGPRAFAESGLTRINLPDSLESIGEDAFLFCVGMECTGNSGTAGAYYCAARGIPFLSASVNEGTFWRALLIGESGYEPVLGGPVNDIACMHRLLSCMNNGWEITRQTDALKEEIFDLIEVTFSDADSNDISLFYYSGHGVTGSTEEYSGALMTVGNEFITTAELADALSGISGKVIVILDSCGSGATISEGEEESTTPEGQADSFDPARFNRSVIRSFSGKTIQENPSVPEVNGEIERYLAGELCQSKFYVLTSSAYEENSISNYSDGSWGGLLTRCIAASAGAGFPTGYSEGAMPADRNADGLVTLNELYLWVANRIGDNQHVLVYPAVSAQIIFYR